MIVPASRRVFCTGCVPLSIATLLHNASTPTTTPNGYHMDEKEAAACCAAIAGEKSVILLSVLPPARATKQGAAFCVQFAPANPLLRCATDSTLFSPARPPQTVRDSKARTVAQNMVHSRTHCPNTLVAPAPITSRARLASPTTPSDRADLLHDA